MNWSQDSLWNKAKLYMGRAIEEQRDGPIFPFLCSLALEFLARSALATVSPAILAESDREHANLLYALGKGTPKKGPISIKASLVFLLCKKLVPNFGPDEFNFCESMSNLRNEELHSGGLPFESLPPDWLSRFYAASEVLLVFQKRSLINFLGKEEAAAARQMIEASEQEIVGKVKKLIYEHKAMFDKKAGEEKIALLAKSEFNAEKMVGRGGHRIACPACKAISWVIGKEVNRQETKFEHGEIVERSAMLPVAFICIACGLQLVGHAQLHVAGIGGQFTRSTRHDPIDFYADMMEPGEEYNNE